MFYVGWKLFKRTKFVTLAAMDFETGRRELDEVRRPTPPVWSNCSPHFGADVGQRGSEGIDSHYLVRQGLGRRHVNRRVSTQGWVGPRGGRESIAYPQWIHLLPLFSRENTLHSFSLSGTRRPREPAMRNARLGTLWVHELHMLPICIFSHCI